MLDNSHKASITFLFADPGDSLLLWEQHPAAMRAAVPRFRDALQQAVDTHAGEVFNFSNDTLHSAFSSAPAAVNAALQAQTALLAVAWEFPLRPRLALLTGSAQRGGDEFLGAAPHRAARLLSVAHGGQVLLCHITADLTLDDLPEGSFLLDLGEHRLPDLTHPERIFQLAAPGLPDDFPPLKSLNNLETNLPSQPNALVGRQSELQTLARMLRSTDIRLVTLTGTGGAGKTRLALQAAADLLGFFREGVYFVPLDQLADPNLVASAIAQALSVEISGSQTVEEALQSHLRSRHTLLVLDNFEHLLPAASLAGDLLAACPQLKILVTSREVLRLYGEQEYPVEPLPLPDPRQPLTLDQLTQFAAVALFIQRARAVRPDFSIDNASAPAVAEICAYLDGLPLAIELAAARVRLFSPQVLLSRLKAESNLQLLSGGPRDLPTRQQTLHKAMEWSYNLLSPAEQALFRRLGVFAGGFTLDAVDAVCNPPSEPSEDTLELLTSLVEKSLIRPSEDGAGQSRFSLLFVLRQFALGILKQTGELPVYRASHAAYYISLAERAAPELTSNNQASWYRLLDLENENLREVMRWGISTENVETGLRLAGAIWRFWIQYGHLAEGLKWIGMILSLPGAQNAPVELRVNTLDGARGLTDFLGDIVSTRAYDEQRLEIFRELGDRQGLAKSLGQLGHLMIQQGESESGVHRLEESIALFRELDDGRGLVVSLNMLADHAMNKGDYSIAESLLAESLTRIDRQTDLAYIALTVSNLGMADLYQGHYDRALEELEESYQIFQSLGQHAHMSDALPWIAYVLLMQGNLLTARSTFEQALIENQKIDSLSGIVSSLDGLAGVATKKGHLERGASLFGSAEALREAHQLPWRPADRRLFDPMIGDSRSQMGVDKFASAWSAGRRLLDGGLDRIIAFALEPDELSSQLPGTENTAGLTKREADILRLLAQGLADAQIAERLFISPRTVNAHLTSIYQKLGVNSRAAATRFAIENGLA